MSRLLQSRMKRGCHSNAVFVVHRTEPWAAQHPAPPGFGAFPGLLDSQSGRQEAMPQCPPARYGYSKLYEITGNLDLVSGITW